MREAGEKRCRICGKRGALIAGFLGVCPECIRRRPEEAVQLAGEAHRRGRRLFGLPEAPPHDPAGTACVLCGHHCRIPEGGRGFCGLRTVRNGRLVHWAGTPQRGLLHWYRDPLPTNCVADPVCTGRHQFGAHNLAVFYASCTFDCLFCQNWHYREADISRGPFLSAEELAAAARKDTYCVCYFGGDPASQMPHALASARLLAQRGVVVCWETAGNAHPKLMDQAVELSLQSGGIVKFDLKAFDERLHMVLTGASNRQTLENFARAARRFEERPAPPLVVASTLLVPGYVDVEEVRRIAGFIAGLHPAIPYVLLGFAPHCFMPDLPTTARSHALAAVEAAKSAGLQNVHIGNWHLLSREEYEE